MSKPGEGTTPQTWLRSIRQCAIPMGSYGVLSRVLMLLACRKSASDPCWNRPSTTNDQIKTFRISPFYFVSISWCSRMTHESPPPQRSKDGMLKTETKKLCIPSHLQTFLFYRSRMVNVEWHGLTWKRSQPAQTRHTLRFRQNIYNFCYLFYQVSRSFNLDLWAILLEASNHSLFLSLSVQFSHISPEVLRLGLKRKKTGWNTLTQRILQVYMCFWKIQSSLCLISLSVHSCSCLSLPIHLPHLSSLIDSLLLLPGSYSNPCYPVQCGQSIRKCKTDHTGRSHVQYVDSSLLIFCKLLLSLACPELSRSKKLASWTVLKLQHVENSCMVKMSNEWWIIYLYSYVTHVQGWNQSRKMGTGRCY